MRGPGRHQRDRREAQARGDRGRRAELRRDLQGAALVRALHHRHHELLPDEAARLLRRRRRVLHRRRRPRQPHAADPPARPEPALLPSDHRTERPARHAAGGDPPRQARIPRRGARRPLAHRVALQRASLRRREDAAGRGAQPQRLRAIHHRSRRSDRSAGAPQGGRHSHRRPLPGSAQPAAGLRGTRPGRRQLPEGRGGGAARDEPADASVPRRGNAGPHRCGGQEFGREGRGPALRLSLNNFEPTEALPGEGPPVRHRLRGIALFFLKYVVGISLIAWMAMTGKLDLSTVGRLPAAMLAQLLALIAVQTVLAAVRVHYILGHQGIRTGLWQCLLFNCSGILYSAFLPGGISGDAVRAYLFMKAVPNHRLPILGAMFLDRLLGMLSMVTLGLGAAVYMAITLPVIRPYLIAFTAIFVALLGGLASMHFIGGRHRHGATASGYLPRAWATVKRAIAELRIHHYPLPVLLSA